MHFDAIIFLRSRRTTESTGWANWTVVSAAVRTVGWSGVYLSRRVVNPLRHRSHAVNSTHCTTDCWETGGDVGEAGQQLVDVETEEPTSIVL